MSTTLAGIILFLVAFLVLAIVYSTFCKVISDMGESWHEGRLKAEKKFQEKLDEEFERKHGKTRDQWERAKSRQL